MEAEKIEVAGIPFWVPSNACDCHMHVFGDPRQYPPSVNRSYTPVEASLPAWNEAMRAIGMRRVVVVQPSAYGTDNACLSDALRQVGPQGRGIASIDDATTDQEIEQLASIGVIGVRINPKSVGNRDLDGLRDLIERTASRIAAIGWHVQLYGELQLIRELADTLRHLPCPFVLDHMAGIEAPAEKAEISPILSLLEEGRCWIKLSGAYRVSRLLSGFGDSTPVARALLNCNPDRLVWGSDWPHTSSHSPHASSDPPDISFRKLDPSTLLRLLAEAAGDELTFARILQANPEALYGFPQL